MGASEEHEAYEAAKNDPKFMNSPAVANPSAISPPLVGTLALPSACRRLRKLHKDAKSSSAVLELTFSIPTSIDILEQ